MPAAMSVTKLAETVGRICAQMQLRTDELNALDAELGDGDLGSTLSAVSCAAIPMLDRKYPDIGSFLNELARTLAATSGSSFSALVMFGLLKTASHMTGKPVLEQESIPFLIDEAVAEMSVRGGAELGDKTVLDGLAAIAEALRNADEGSDPAVVSRAAMGEALSVYRQSPSRMGRARIAGDRSVGNDDPGMKALALALEAI
ncbi:MAG: DAK2 domain-containing protein [Phyllobacteriaceae bacterium]|nr:DAK2 domain-containing protein [Phyllobacteriaceae bacterium]